MEDQVVGISADEEEREHWWDVMRNFLHHLDFFEMDLGRRQLHLNLLSESHMHHLPKITFDKFSMLFEKARINQEYLDDMVTFYAQNSYLDPPTYAIEHFQNVTMKQVSDDGRSIPLLPIKDVGPSVEIGQQHRIVATLHSLYREWSAEGKSEREECFQPIIAQLQTHLPISDSSKFLRVAVPGCGLGRLPLEIASRGYCCEGNEFSA
jgi:carnosine N-methyltransferase